MTKQKIMLFDNENNTFYSEEIKLIMSDQIETQQSIYPKKDFKQYFDEDNNTIIYISEIDLAAKLEAENIKKLRRSSAINNMFNYQTTKQLDFMALVPYLIIVLMVLFS